MERIKDSHPNKEYRYILIILLVSLGIILFKEMRIFLSGFLGAITLYSLLKWQMKKLVNKWQWKKVPAALIIDLEALFIFLIPITVVIIIALDTFSGITINTNGIREWINTQILYLENKFNIDIFAPENLSNLLSDNTLSSIPQIGSTVLQTIATGGYSLIINLLVTVFVLYFILVEHESFETLIKEMLPFRAENKKVFIEETTAIIRANAIGIPFLATVQGGLAYVGYLIFGVDNALLYAVLTAFATIIPIIGTAIVYLPLAIIMLMQQQIGVAIGLTAYGLIVIGTSDNIIRLLLQKQLADIHPLITLFGVLIGIPMFGFWGVVFGPLLLSIFMLFINMYRHDYIKDSKATLKVTSDYNKRDYNKIRKLKNKRPFKKKQPKLNTIEEKE